MMGFLPRSGLVQPRVEADCRNCLLPALALSPARLNTALGIMKASDALLALTRYWLCADELRSSFFDAYRKANPRHLIEAHGALGLTFYWVSGPGIFSSLWFSSLYVVIEGYRELSLDDAEINILLQTEHSDALRIYRNATFHFQNDVFHEKRLKLHKTRESEEWLDKLHKRFGVFLSERVLNLANESDKPDPMKMRVALAARLVASDNSS